MNKPKSTNVKRARLMRAIKRYAKTQIALSWQGSQPPEDHPRIEMDAKLAEVLLSTTIKELLP
jgi:hypothetical protein